MVQLAQKETHLLANLYQSEQMTIKFSEMQRKINQVVAQRKTWNETTVIQEVWITPKNPTEVIKPDTLFDVRIYFISSEKQQELNYGTDEKEG